MKAAILAVTFFFFIVQTNFVKADENQKNFFLEQIRKEVSAIYGVKSKGDVMASFLKRHPEITQERIQQGKMHWTQVADINKDGEVSECEALKAFHNFFTNFFEVENFILHKIVNKGDETDDQTKANVYTQV